MVAGLWHWPPTSRCRMAGRRIATAQLGCSQPVKRPCTHGLRPFYSCKNCWPWTHQGIALFCCGLWRNGSGVKSRLKLQRTADKNPTHEKWRTEWVYNALYELSELAEYVDLTQAQKRAESDSRGFGRTCTVFDKLRLWGHTSPFASIGLVPLLLGVRLFMPKRKAAMSLRALSVNEVRAIGKSVAKWVWAWCRCWG